MTATIIHCGRLFDGTGADPVDDATLVVEDGTLAAGQPPPGADEIDLRHAFVLPGLIDAHTHLSMIPARGDQLGQLRQPPGAQALRVAGNIAKDLAAGTTTMRIMTEEDWLDVHVREAIEDGTLEGPDLLIATRGLAPINGHGRGKTAFDGVEEIRRGARENLSRGADFLKLFATGGVASGTGLSASAYSLDEMRAAVEEAERAGTYVAAHAHGGPGLLTAVEAGVRTIEHAAVAGDAELEAMLERDCWLVGTFSILFHPEGIEGGDAGNPQILANLEAARERVAERMQGILASGIRFALGTDSVHGKMAYEVQAAIRFGVRPHDALLAATARGAEALRIEDRKGTLEPGKAADVIAVDGDPLADPAALERILFVMKGGRRLR